MNYEHYVSHESKSILVDSSIVGQRLAVSQNVRVQGLVGLSLPHAHHERCHHVVLRFRYRTQCLLIHCGACLT